MSRLRLPLKTYSHLAAARKVPSEYELVSSKLLYYVERGFEVNAPLSGWYARYQRGSKIGGVAWDRFADPRETTYTRYTALQAEKEHHLDALLRAPATAEHDAGVSAEAWGVLGRVLGPLRFAAHGLQMLAAYVGQMAPEGRITIAALLQAADEIRRVHRLAYRTAQIRRVYPGFAEDARARWQDDPAWQPLRRAIEEALCAYDWGEALIALNVCLKPVCDGLLVTELGRWARAEGHFPTAVLLASLDEDCAWQRAWTTPLLALVLGGRPENRAAVEGWVARWYPAARAAVLGLGPILGPDAAGRALVAGDGWLRGLGLEAPRS